MIYKLPTMKSKDEILRELGLPLEVTIMTAMEECASEVRKEMMEFTEWCGENEFFRNKGKDGKWIFQSDPYIIWKSTDELYEYWQKEVKG